MDTSYEPETGWNEHITGMIDRCDVGKAYFAGGPFCDRTTAQDNEIWQGHTDDIYAALRSKRKCYSLSKGRSHATTGYVHSPAGILSQVLHSYKEVANVFQNLKRSQAVTYVEDASILQAKMASANGILMLQ